MARRLLFLAAVAALSGSAPAVAVVSGEQRLLVIRATWGPKPFSTEQVQASVFGDVDAFFRASSFGRVWFTGAVTPWLHAYDSAPACNPIAISYDADAAARAAGYDPSAYDELAYLFPTNDCAWTGARWGKRVLLNGTLTLTNTAHELGHTFGLPHAHSWSCVPRPCGVVNLGDPYDTMGSGTGDFDSYEKWLLGWITRVTFASRAGTYRIAPIEKPSLLPQGFVVTTSRNRYWFEVRSKPARDEQGVATMPGGLLVHIGPSPALGVDTERYGLAANLLVMDPVGRASPLLRAGDRFGERGAFRIRVLRRAGSAARLRFAWIDTRAPGRPSIVLPGAHVRPSAGLTVTWADSIERGSGIARYLVSLDRGSPVSIGQSTYPALNSLWFPHIGRGAHTVASVALDRAGNRSSPAVRRFVVGGPS